MQGKVKGRPVLVLIDNRASHNFISSELVCLLSLHVEISQLYNVRLGDRHSKQTQGCCKDVEVQRKEYTIKETFFLSQLGRVDLILGVT